MTDSILTPNSSPTSGLRIRRVTIRNFRCIDEIQIELEPGTTYLVVRTTPARHRSCWLCLLPSGAVDHLTMTFVVLLMIYQQTRRR